MKNLKKCQKFMKLQENYSQNKYEIMKKLAIRLIALVFASLPLMAMAQTPIDKLYEKYAGKEGFTSINISPEMFKMFSSEKMDMGQNNEDMQEAISQVSSMKILSYEPKDGDASKFRKEVEESLDLSGFKTMMVVDSDEGGVKFLAKQENDKIVEFLMLAGDNEDFTVMSFMGNMDLETLGKISQSMNIQGMNINMNHDKDKDEEE